MGVAGVAGVDDLEEVEEGEEIWAFVIAAQAAKDVQERQLDWVQVSKLGVGSDSEQDSRFAILAQNDTFWEFFRRLCGGWSWFC